MRELIRVSWHGMGGGRLLGRLAGLHPRLRRAINLMCVVVIVASATLIARTTNASYVNVLTNGNFESNFTNQAGCGMVGSGWHCFTNGGAANYGFYDDQWNLTVADGGHSQLIEINTKGVANPDHDRYAGIYQTVRVVDWANYTLSLRGMIRTTNLTGDPWRYRVQVGWTAGPNASWGAVTNWIDVGWDTYYERTAPGGFKDFSTDLMAEDDVITVYLRVWKKWGVPDEEIDINFDAVALTGPSPAGYWTPPAPSKPQPHTDGHHYPAGAAMAPIYGGACSAQELVYNGGFEQGFNVVAVGHVGKSWGYFTNGGAANYGFYDEQWPPVVVEGVHGQLIEINSKGVVAPDPDRYAGIYQRIGWLQAGQTYELTIKGLLRGAGNEDDPYRFEAQWGYNAGHDTDWSHVTNWQGMDLGKIHPRTEPGGMATYTVRFTAPASNMVLFIRGWKKWGVGEVEMDFNLDAISLRGCAAPPPPQHKGEYHDKHYNREHDQHHKAHACVYVVQPGDILGWIAERQHVSLHDLMYANSIHNADLIYVGQKLHLPGCAAAVEPSYHPPAQKHPPAYSQRTHTIQPGETLSYLCDLYGVDVWALVEANQIADPNLVYVGQVLVIP
jgi:LysM repeat protein